MATNWEAKFFESTRGQVVTQLRRPGGAVEELARAQGRGFPYPLRDPPRAA